MRLCMVCSRRWRVRGSTAFAFCSSIFISHAVYEQIDALSQAQKPRRSKSISKSVDRTPSRGASPPSESVPSRLRVSSESAGSLGGAALAHSRRSSSDSKSRKKFFASHERTESADHDDGNSFELMMVRALFVHRNERQLNIPFLFPSPLSPLPRTRRPSKSSTSSCGRALP